MESWFFEPTFLYLGIKIKVMVKTSKKELMELLMTFQRKLEQFDQETVQTWSIEGLGEELDELISQTADELLDEE